jgi:hypothetical protein
MGQRKEPEPLPHPEIVAGMVLVVMGVYDDVRLKGTANFQESVSPVDETRIDQKPVDKEGMNLKKWDAEERAGHFDGSDRAVFLEADRYSLHVPPSPQHFVKKQTYSINSNNFVKFSPYD